MGNKYKGYTPAQNAAQQRYMKDKVALRTIVSRDERDAIQAAAQAAGQSVNAYTRQAIAERMERDNHPRQRQLDVKPSDGDTLVAHDRETGEAVARSVDGINWLRIDGGHGPKRIDTAGE